MYMTSDGGTSSAVEIKENLFTVKWEIVFFSHFEEKPLKPEEETILLWENEIAQKMCSKLQINLWKRFWFLED